MKGTVHISTDIIIDNVYYSPEFRVNLISISKLTASSNFHVSFTDKHAIFLDKVMMREAGQAKLVKGLYLLPHTPGLNSTESFVCNISSSVWHNRLGHTNSSRLHHILKSLNLHFEHWHDYCDICHLAK